MIDPDIYAYFLKTRSPVKLAKMFGIPIAEAVTISIEANLKLAEETPPPRTDIENTGENLSIAALALRWKCSTARIRSLVVKGQLKTLKGPYKGRRVTIESIFEAERQGARMHQHNTEATLLRSGWEGSHITVADYADRLGITEGAIYARIRRGKLLADTFQGVQMIPTSALSL